MVACGGPEFHAGMPMRIIVLGVCLLLAGCRKTDTAREWEGKLQDPNPEVRARAARELGKRGSDAAGSVDKLTQALKSADADERQSAATALGKIGEPANVAVPALIEALSDAEWPVRRAAALALGEI